MSNNETDVVGLEIQQHINYFKSIYKRELTLEERLMISKDYDSGYKLGKENINNDCGYGTRNGYY